MWSRLPRLASGLSMFRRETFASTLEQVRTIRLLLHRFVLLCFFVGIAIALPRPALAHELTPSIGDFRVVDGELAMRLRLNLEAFVAGMDLDAVVDTDSDAKAAEYQRLREMVPEELALLAENYFSDWFQRFEVQGSAPMRLRLEGVEIGEIGDPELPRASHVFAFAPLPEGTKSLRFQWPIGSGALVLRQNDVPEPFTGYFLGGETSPEIMVAGGSSMTAMEAFVAYIPIGFDHILPKGLDHILFVLGLFFFSARLRPLVWQVTAFTLAHTVTLALGSLGWVSVPGQIVEPLIAASIVFVAVENIFVRRMRPWRPIVIFGFGLLHGLGFASVLAEFGLPQAQFIPALLGFNIGVEMGQLTVIALAFGLVGYWFRDKIWYRGRIAIPASVLIAAVGSYWCVERVFL